MYEVNLKQGFFINQNKYMTQKGMGCANCSYARTYVTLVSIMMVLYGNLYHSYSRSILNKDADAIVCPSEPPIIKHGNASMNATHITYTCEEGYAFWDTGTQKSLVCGCEMLVHIAPCSGMLIQSL